MQLRSDRTLNSRSPHYRLLSEANVGQASESQVCLGQLAVAVAVTAFYYQHLRVCKIRSRRTSVHVRGHPTHCFVRLLQLAWTVQTERAWLRSEYIQVNQT